MAEKAQVPAVKDKAKAVVSNVKFDSSFIAGAALGALVVFFLPRVIAKVKPKAEA